MNDAQQVFYIVATIALGLFAIFLIFAAVAIIMAIKKLNQIVYKYQVIKSEISELVENGRSYSRYLGASLTESVLKLVLRMLRRIY